jgi:hypothetical protein
MATLIGVPIPLQSVVSYYYYYYYYYHIMTKINVILITKNYYKTT